MYQRRRVVLVTIVHVSRVLLLVVAAIALLTGAAPAAVTPTTAAHPATTAARTEPVQVVVVDHTHGQWAGISDAVDGWNRSPYVRMVVADQCRPGVYCVTLRAVHKGRTWWGADSLPHGPNRAVVRLSVGVRDSAYPTASGQASVVCHELGHTLGLTHPSRSERVAFPDRVGCIAATRKHRSTAGASADDLAKLALLATGREQGEGWGAVGRLPLEVRRSVS